jgi:hypothetical protein
MMCDNTLWFNVKVCPLNLFFGGAAGFDTVTSSFLQNFKSMFVKSDYRTY